MVRLRELTLLSLRDLCDVDFEYAVNFYSSRLGDYLVVKVLKEALDVERFPYRVTGFGRQYLADAIIQEGLRLKGEGVLIMLTSSDIYTYGVNYVFGLAVKGCAVVSRARIDPAFWKGVDEIYAYTSLGRLFFEKQFGKVLLHEFGHAIGLPHCIQSCVMRYSNSPLELYQKEGWFCNRCFENLLLATTANRF